MKATFGEKLKELRQKRKLTREILAEQLGISAKQVQRYEEDTSAPSRPAMRRLMEIFHYDFNRHFYGTSIVHEDDQSIPNEDSSGLVSVSAAERISELRLDKKILQEAISSSLATIQASQQVLLSTMAQNHQVLLMVLDRVKSDTKEILDQLKGGQMIGEGKSGDQPVPPSSKGRKRA